MLVHLTVAACLSALQDITRKEKGGQGRDDENSVEEDTQYLIAAEAAHAAAPYHQLNEEFDQMLQESTVSLPPSLPPSLSPSLSLSLPLSLLPSLSLSLPPYLLHSLPSY